MKKVKKALFCLLTMLFFVNLISCNHVSQGEAGKNYKEKSIVEGWKQAAISCLCVKDEALYFSTFEDVGELNGELTSRNRLYVIKENKTQPEEISVGISEKYEHVRVSDIMCGNETISMWLGTSDSDEYEPVNLLIQMDLEYNVINQADLNQAVNNENILKVSSSNLYVIDSSLKLVKSFDLNGNALGVAYTKEEKILCLKEDHDKKKIMIFDLDKMRVEKELSVESCNANSEYGIISGGKFDFSYRTDDGIYGYNMSDQKSVCELDFDRYGIDGEEIEDVLYSDMDELVFSIRSNEGGESRIALYSPDDNQSKRTKIVYGTFQTSSRMRNAIQTFNKNNNDYVMETKEYFNEDEGESVEDAIRKLNEDIASGEVPDLLDLSLLSDRYASMGLYQDLSNYIVDSEKMSEDMFLENVFTALRKEDKLYTISHGFTVATLLCKKEENEKYDGLNIQKLEEISGKPADGELFLVSNTKDELLSIMLEGSLGDYYDWKSGTCQFDSGEFRQLLEFCNRFDFGDNHNINKKELIQKNRKSLVSENGFVPSDIIEYRNLFGGEIAYIGYPNNNGFDSYFMFENQIGIYSNSDEKDGAWQFIEMILSYDYQKQFVDIYNDDALIPLRKDCYNELLNNMISAEEYNISIEEKDDFDKMVNSIKKSSSYDTVMMQIILEEAQTYFNGKKSVDEIAKLIQSRCETYMSEMR